MDGIRWTVMMAVAGSLALGTRAEGQGASALSEIERAQGFVSMFDGTREDFQKHFVTYKQGDTGNVVLSPEWQADAALQAMTTSGASTNYIRSSKRYADFDFRFDYRNDSDGGVFYRFTVDLSVPYGTGLEFSIIDDEDNCLTCAAAVHRMYKPAPLIYRKRAGGEWNHGRIVAVKDSVEHWLNGSRILGFKYHSPDFWVRFDAARWDSVSARWLTFKVPGNRKGGYIEKGYLGFQAVKGDHWQLRNVRVNGASPRLGEDEWWGAAALSLHTAAPGRGTGAASKVPGTAPRFGSPLLGKQGITPVTADGRTPAH